MDNSKEIELHHYEGLLTSAGFNTFAFDGPGQGEMWNDMKFIDGFEVRDKYHLDLKRIGTLGWSLGGYLSPRAAAFDHRISCAIGSGGPAHARYLSNKKKVNPILLKGIPHLVGPETYPESLRLFDIDISTAPPMDRPLKSMWISPPSTGC
jgi:hypothetical protein